MFEDVIRAVDRLADAIRDCDELPADDESLLSAVGAASAARAAADALLARLAADAERLGTPRRCGLSLRELLMRHGCAPSVASRSIRVGRAIAHMPAVARHLRDGAMSGEMADAVARGVAHVTVRTRSPLGSDLARESEVMPIGHALAGRTPAEIAERARQIALGHSPVRAGDDTGAHVAVAGDSTLNGVSWRQGEDGRLTGAFDLDVLTGERLIACVDAASRPRPRPDGARDARSADRRRADAFAQLLECASRAVAGDGLVAPPKTDVVVTVPAGVVATARGGPRLQWLGAVSGDAASLASCDASVTRMALDKDAAPVDITPAKRLFTGSVRKAVIVRDECCVKCGAPASWTDVHHIVPHSAGGPTTCDNGCLLCRTCHVAVHQHGWDVEMGPDRHPWLRPPGSVDRRRAWQPAYNRRTLRLDATA